MKTDAQILRTARSFIEKPENWIQGTTRSGNRWDITGAIFEASDGRHDRLYAELLELVKPGLIKNPLNPMRFLGLWNDNPQRTHAEVLAALDAFIASKESA